MTGKEMTKAEEAVLSGRTPWWMCPLKPTEGEAEPHEILDRQYEILRNDQDSRYNAYKEYERLFYSNAVSGDEDINLVLTGELKQNELANTIETLWAQVFKTKIVPAICTSEADYEQWARAKDYGRWLEGALDDAKMFDEAMPTAGLYALVYGTGPIKVYGVTEDGKRKKGKVKARAVNPKYLMVDKISAKHGKPKTLFEKDHIDRWELLATYGQGDGMYGDEDDRRVSILKSGSNDDPDLGTQNLTDCDMVTVKEAWHLPSKPGSKDGRHCIWICGQTLVYEEFSWDSFPFIWIRYGAKLEGFWGISAVHRLAGMQELLDKLNKKLDESQDVMGVPRILLAKDSGIRKVDIDDVPGGILECDNINGVKEWNAQTAAPELYSDRDATPGKMRALLGISNFESTQQLPQGMRDISGDFLERLVDQGQARHAMFHKEYERAAVDSGYLFMLMAADLEDDGYDVAVKAPGTTSRGVESLSFKDVKIDTEHLKLRILPMSQLPQTFSGRIEAIQKLKDLMPNMAPQTVARMTEVPDVDGQTDLMVSNEEIIMKNIHFMVKKNKYLPPLPFDDHKLIVALTTRFINMYRVKDDYSLDVESLLVKYAEEASALSKGLGGQDPNAPPPPMMQPVGPDGMPTAVPGMAPQGPPGAPPMGPPPGMGPPPMGPQGPPMQ